MIEQYQKISSSAILHHEKLISEEITKTVLIFPFLKNLGFDVSNPSEIIPEYHADFANIKADKADLCIIIDNKPSIIIEAKKLGTKFEAKHRRQLAQYFHWVKSVNLAILTDGIEYEFYSDLNNENKMDETPFYTLSIHNLSSDNIKFLELISKEKYNASNVLDFANTLNITKILLNQITENFVNPSEDYVKFILGQILEKLPNKVINSKAKNQYLPNIIQAHKNLIDEEIRKRLGVNIENQNIISDEKENKNMSLNDENKEIEEIKNEYKFGFEIIKAISCELIDVERLFLRNTQNYCNILIDDNKLKTVARMMFNNPNRLRLNIFDDKEEVLELSKLADIYKYSNKIKLIINRILNNKKETTVSFENKFDKPLDEVV